MNLRTLGLRSRRRSEPTIWDRRTGRPRKRAIRAAIGPGSFTTRFRRTSAAGRPHLSLDLHREWAISAATRRDRTGHHPPIPQSWADAFNRQAVAGERCDAYTSEADFILKNGRSFEYAALPRGVRMGRPRECFRNAATLALRKPDIYMYVEGYAVNRWMAMHTVAHAWCIGSDNFVVDPTWDEGTEYFGVPFRHDYLSRVLKARRDYGLIDNPEMDFPLVTGAHPVDEAVINWREESTCG